MNLFDTGIWNGTIQSRKHHHNSHSLEWLLPLWEAPWMHSHIERSHRKPP